MIRFKYNDKIYAPANFEKKLKALGITKEDVEILEDTNLKKLSDINMRGQSPYTHIYRLNCNTIFAAYSQEELDDLLSHSKLVK